VISPADNRLTPDAVQAAAFPQARIGRRGLDEDHVRAFCGVVERELVRLLNERASLTAEVQRLRQLGLGQSGGGPGVTRRPDDTHVRAARVLSEAQQTAQRYVADAQEYSMRLAAEAQRRRDEMLAEARSRAAVLLEEAYGEVSRATRISQADPPQQPHYPPFGWQVPSR
jgi:cell division septum initiation protein DivIVA